MPPANVRVAYGTNGNFSAKVLIDSFVKDILASFIAEHDLRHATLILDQAPCHKTEELRQAALHAHTTLLFVPPSLTNLLQPANVSWMRPFKQRFHQRWTDWYINEERELTRFNNSRSPGYVTVVEWISEIWADLDRTMIKQSFKKCGITTHDDNEFHSPLAQLCRTHELPDLILDEERQEEFIFEEPFLDEDFEALSLNESSGSEMYTD